MSIGMLSSPATIGTGWVQRRRNAATARRNSALTTMNPTGIRIARGATRSKSDQSVKLPAMRHNVPSTDNTSTDRALSLLCDRYRSSSQPIPVRFEARPEHLLYRTRNLLHCNRIKIATNSLLCGRFNTKAQDGLLDLCRAHAKFFGNLSAGE